MSNNMLEIGGVKVNELVEKVQTPMFVYDEGYILNQIDLYQSNFKSDKFDTEIIYASKAFSCKAMVQLIKDTNTSLDVVSGGELYVAKLVGMDMSKVYFHGNNKTDEELEMAVDYGCKVVLDNIEETKALKAVVEAKKKNIEVLLRVNPGVEAHTHEYIVTAKLDSKFGLSVTLEDQIDEVMNLVNGCEFLKFHAFHSHIGSQIFDTTGFKLAIEKLINFTNKYANKFNMEIEALNLGGGFGVKYTDEDKPLKVNEMSKVLIDEIERLIEETNSSIKKVMIEPGRSIVGEAGYTLYSVGFQKQTANKKYVFVDGGMTDNIRVALYQAKYDCVVANKMNEKAVNKVDIAGKCCESGDVLLKEAMLPEVEKGDILAFLTTGAYGYSMASNYNRLNKLPVVFVKDGKARIVINRETYDDQLSLDTNTEI